MLHSETKTTKIIELTDPNIANDYEGYHDASQEIITAIMIVSCQL